MTNFGNYGRGKFDKILVKDITVTDDVTIAGDWAVTGTLAVTSTSTFTGAVSIDDTTATTSGITGSLHTDGGVGIAGALYVGTTSALVGNVTVGSASGTGADVRFYGDTATADFLWDQNGDTNGSLTLGADTKSVDLRIYGLTTGNYLHWDGSGDDLLLVGTATQLAVAGTTESTSTTTGSLRTAGGLACVGDFYAGDDIFLTSAAVLNFNAGNLTLTHASGSLSIAGSTAGTSLNITSAAPTAANNGVYSLMTSSAGWTGSLAAIRGRNTVTATGAGGNCYGGWFNLLFSSGAPTGLGLSAGLYVEAGSNIATTGVSSVLMATLLGDADGAITTSPILTLADASTLKTKYLMEVGFNAGGTLVGTAADSTAVLFRTGGNAASNIQNKQGLQIMVNGADYYIPLIAVADWQDD